MDWFSWLSKTGLEPSLVYEYGLAFAHNELEEEDISYFNHEFLQSMGISIAKHRLEILKLARKERGNSSPSILRVLAVIKKSKKCLSRYVNRWVRREESALVVVSRPPYGMRWKDALLKRNKKLVMINQGRLMLTNGSLKVSEAPALSVGSSPMVYDLYKEDKLDDDGYWSTTEGVEDIRMSRLEPGVKYIGMQNQQKIRRNKFDQKNSYPSERPHTKKDRQGKKAQFKCMWYTFIRWYDLITFTKFPSVTRIQNH